MMKHDESLESVKQAIRGAGLRVTPARIAILQLLRLASSPQTHADVAEQLSPIGVDNATVFRNLNVMTRKGLLRRAELGDHVWRFEIVGSEAGRVAAHPHFLCIECGEVTCLDDVELTPESRLETERVGEVTEILVRGHCNSCRVAC